MLTGKIIDWNHERGFGFIARDDGEPDVFVHCCALLDQTRDHLPIGARIQFDVQTDERNGKLRAIKVAELACHAIEPPTRAERRQELRRCFHHDAERRRQNDKSPREAAHALFRFSQ